MHSGILYTTLCLFCFVFPMLLCYIEFTSNTQFLKNGLGMTDFELRLLYNKHPGNTARSQTDILVLSSGDRSRIRNWKYSAHGWFMKWYVSDQREDVWEKGWSLMHLYYLCPSWHPVPEMLFFYLFKCQSTKDSFLVLPLNLRVLCLAFLSSNTCSNT